MNSVKLYSNGSAVISKSISLDGDTKVSIPVNKNDLDEVVSSIAVFGNVTLPNPPSYTSANSDQTTLDLDSENVIRDLAIKLRGADAVIHNNGSAYKGKIFGIQTTQVRSATGEVSERFNVVLGTDKGIVQLSEQSISSIQFTDPEIQAEIDKALKASLQDLKPESRFVDLTLVPQNGATEATVAYATPVAAWKIRYQLRFLKGIASLEGQAVVDNDTDDDWKEVNLSVIVGEPISFSTDIAEIRRPTRSRVNVVSDTTVGAVNAAGTVRRTTRAMAKSMRLDNSGGTETMSFEAAPCMSAVMDPNSFVSSNGLESAYGGAAPGGDIVFPCLDVADVQDSGDFSIYSSPNPVTILSKKSAIIGLFSTPMDNAQTVLLYKDNQNIPNRPYRAVKVKNTTSNPWGRGVCEIYLEGDRQGKCVIEPTKQGEEAFLVHAVETGVKVFRTSQNTESKMVSLQIKDGVIYSGTKYCKQTTYQIDNAKAEQFDFDIEYVRNWAGSKIVIQVEDGPAATTQDTVNGQRISTKLAANGNMLVTVTESTVQANSWILNANWLKSSIILTKHPLSRNERVNAIVEIQATIDSTNYNIQQVQVEINDLEQQQDRLLKLIPNMHPDKAVQYKNDLDEAEQSLRSLKKQKLPELKGLIKTQTESLQVAMAKLVADWEDSDCEEEDPGK